MRWAVFGTYDKGRHPRVAVLIEGLRAQGDEVVEINAPLRLDTAGRVRMLRQPWRVPLLIGELARRWTRLTTAAWPVRTGRFDAVLVGYLGHFDVRLARRLFRRVPIVLDHLVSAAGTARDRGLAGRGVKDRLMLAIDDGALRRADVVVVDTGAQQAALPPDAVARSVVVPVGATTDWFAAGRDGSRPAAGPLRAIFVGLFTPLHGTTTLAAALAALATDDIEVTMVGTGQDYARCREVAADNPRVRWVDWVDGAQLPALVAAHHVCLGIFGTTAKARAVVPTKVYQGAAAGCVVVTSDTAPQREALGPAAMYVPPGDAAALADALRRLAADRSTVDSMGWAAHVVARARFTPEAVVAPLRERVAEVAVAAGRG